VAWLFTQVWVLCLVAFLLGALVTWLAFVRPAQRAARDVPDRPAAPAPPAWALTARPQVPEQRAEDHPPPPAEEPTVPPVNPALAALNGQSTDTRGRSTPAVGTAAVGALDLLGVHTEPPQPPQTPPPAEPPAEKPERPS
jgi:hypothetical protein